MNHLRKSKLGILVALLSILLLVTLAGCAQKESPAPAENQPAETKVLKLATTTSTEDTGLLDYLLPEFTKDTGYEVQVIAVGTGQAIEMGEAGDVDVILVHSRAAEDKFVEEGYGVDRRDVMYNDFLIIGPADDPAGIKGEPDVLKAFAAIKEKQAPFVSRGDDSGTDKKEKGIWQKANITPEGDWYIEVGQGMGDTFRMADEKKAYTLIDRGTYLALKDNYQLEPMVEGSPDLLNPYGVIPVNPEKHPNVDFEGATAFAEWLTSEKGQKMIGEFGVDKFGQQLFVPDAK
ncbi:MAG TPA: extracellular solute-binding protein [Syntrophomonadaceae bacterium]|nr:extracellular solute-binding protein [Syntrophomonadaceae bacterium]HQA07019.1 extracellular solute-binding protein [Syntrophomonadaceae bacterium]HQE23350.1 extracellular solute-binding protein [Syntrophomonadaceae bacterium]